MSTTTLSLPRLRHRSLPGPSVLLAGAGLAVLLAAALWPGLLTSADPGAGQLLQAYQGPGGAHWLGTDQLGRDVYARIVHGAAQSLFIGVGATALGAAGGLVIGLLAAVGGRFADEALMRVLDILLALPGLLLALLVITVVGPGNLNTALAIGIAEIAAYSRLVRSKALTVRAAGYVEAARVAGHGRARVVLRHILPNSAGPLLALAVVGVGRAMIEGSALSFLGLGAQPPTPEWGSMLADGRNALGIAWWTAAAPGVAVTLAVVVITVVGRRLQARFEGRG
ncbi:ABC transporter permease [Kitasatospora sp. NPDC057223]|uniref:ABC transporter permease n=1 Tax=Kitasatospora sp. NPDC057223 TaxID=3346055 RepID=UPI003643E994